MKQKALFIIDPQRDFCDKDGALFVPGATEDMYRLSDFIAEWRGELDEIFVSMDCHQSLHIAHPIFWHNAKGEMPSVYTVITNEDIVNKVWEPFHPELFEWAKFYTASLKKNGRYELRIWPPHCLVGTVGQTINPSVTLALTGWEIQQLNRVFYIQKGNNFRTEQYSALQADVPDPLDYSTSLNLSVIRILKEFNEIIIAGEALSHCVASTVTDLANNIGEDNIKKITLLTDATSNVTGCEALGKTFIEQMVNRGMRLSTTTTWKP